MKPKGVINYEKKGAPIGVALLFCALVAAIPSLQAQTTYTITVQSGGRQIFNGFGASHVSMGYASIPAGARLQIADIVYRDLKAIS